MDQELRARMLGHALARGLISWEAFRCVWCGGGDPLEALERAGALDGEDLRVLEALAREDGEADGTGHPLPGDGSQGAVSQEAATLWDSLPPSGPAPDGSGRKVLRVLTLPAWHRYRNLRFLAEGGMGRVFRAFEPGLRRMVALKFLRRSDPATVHRFTLEAQHQAQVEHPGICRVYEAGEWEGQSYIAMQLLTGETLERAAGRLTRDERVRMMEAVAEAVHAAHHHGLIHRDLKPANVMIERDARGLRPVILDFGLSRGLDATGCSQQGLAVGTLHYMAPEQAKGEADRVTRRTDVYGLGATLHKVLTGRAPFAEAEGLEAIRAACEEDVPSLRRLVPDLPEDLDTIVRKCLEKEPSRRYESALAVAEDLRRWREGEPILARRPTLVYRAGKWARRHRLVVAVGAAGAAGLMALGLFAGYTSYSANARARYAQHFGQEAERIEALRRYACLLPLHDVGVEQTQARARLSALEAEARRVGHLAEGPAAYALGRGHLALGDVEEGRALLERAWACGLRTPELALALGRALAASYQRAMDLARALPSRELREARERELARDLRGPALARLREGNAAALESPAFHRAQVALVDGRWDEAQALAREALGATPWLFDAKRLEGEALLERSRAVADPDRALACLAQAEEALAASRCLGPSDPFTALDEVRVLAERVARELASGRRPEASLDRCRTAAARARILLPQDGEPPAQLASALAGWAELRSPRDSATVAAMGEAMALSSEALALAPGNPAVMGIRVSLLLRAGCHARGLGLDPLPWFREALALARWGQERFPQEPVFPALVASACMRKMTWEINTGTPPWASFEEGLDRARVLRDRFPDLSWSYHGLAALWVERAEYERIHGLDPRASVAAALGAVAAARARGLHLAIPGWTEGDAQLIQGQYLLAIRGDGEEDLLRAAEAYGRAFQANPNLRQADVQIAEAMLGVAQGRLERGLDAAPALREAELHLGRSGGRSGERGQSLYLAGCLALLQGRRSLAAGADPGPAWARAELLFGRAAAFDGAAKAHAGLAEVRARAYLRRGREGDRLRALAAARVALERDPMRAEAWLWTAVVEQEALRRGTREAEPREAWTRALALDANLGRWAKQLGRP